MQLMRIRRAALAAILIFSSESLAADPVVRSVESELSLQLTISGELPRPDGSTKIQRIRFTTKDLIRTFAETHAATSGALGKNLKSARIVLRRELRDDAAAKIFLVAGGKDVAIPPEDAADFDLLPPHEIAPAPDLPANFFASAAETKLRKTSAGAAAELVSARGVQPVVLVFGDVAKIGIAGTLIGLETSSATALASGVRALRFSSHVVTVAGGVETRDTATPDSVTTAKAPVEGKVVLTAERILGVSTSTAR